MPLTEAGNLGRQSEWDSEKISLVLKNLDKLSFRELADLSNSWKYSSRDK